MPIILTKADHVHARLAYFNPTRNSAGFYYAVLSLRGFTSFWMPTGSRTYAHGVQQLALEYTDYLREQLSREYGFAYLLSELSDADRR